MVDNLNVEGLEALADDDPVVMVNLLRFRERAADGNGSGWDAYLRYSEPTMKLIKQRGGTVLWAGRGEAVALGAAGEGWDYVVLVRYPSRAAFLDMMRSPEYAAANVHREAAAEHHVIVAMAETYSKLAR